MLLPSLDAINNRPGVSDATRKRILAVAEAVGWRPNHSARVLSGKPVNAVGLVLNRPAQLLAMEPFFMELISGIEMGFSRESVALMLQVVGSVEAEMATYKAWWTEHRVDGVLVVDLRVDDLRIPFLTELGMPTVVLGEPGHTGSFTAVWNDDGAAVIEAVRYLIMLGHRRIGHVIGRLDFLYTKRRDDVFRRTVADAGATGWSVATDYSAAEGARATRSLLLAVQPPTAIVYDNDLMAIAGLAVARELGVRVPEDLSLVAWDGSILCRFVHPPLTVMTRDIVDHGRVAAEQLLKLIHNQDVENIQVPTAHLTPQGSTGPFREPGGSADVIDGLSSIPQNFDSI